MSYDPYFVLSDFADELWNLYQNTMLTQPKDSEQARSMYEALENIYLEPIRRSKARENTEKYRAVASELKDQTEYIDKQIRRIAEITENTRKISECAAIFDRVIATAAKFLVLL